MEIFVEIWWFTIQIAVRLTEYRVRNSLINMAEAKGIPLKIIKLETMEQAQATPTSVTIFTLFIMESLSRLIFKSA